MARQRRLGKTLNMDTLRCFLTDKEDLRHLFKGLYIEKSPVWEMANSAPVFYFDFKELTANGYKNEILKQVYKHICSYLDQDDLKGYMKMLFDDLIVRKESLEHSLRVLTGQPASEQPAAAASLVFGLFTQFEKRQDVSAAFEVQSVALQQT